MSTQLQSALSALSCAPLRTVPDVQALLACVTSSVDALDRGCLELDLSGVLAALADAVIALDDVYLANINAIAREAAAEWRFEDQRTEAV